MTPPGQPDTGIDKPGTDAAAQMYYDACDKIFGILQTLRDSLASAAATPTLPDGDACWSDDDAGKTFAHGANGSPGYAKNGEVVLEGLAKLATAMNSVGDALAGTKRALTQADLNAEKGLPLGPPGGGDGNPGTPTAV